MPALTNPSRESIRKRNVGSNFDKSDVFEEIVLAQLTAFALPGRIDMFRYTTEGLRASTDQPEHQVYDRLERIAVPTLVISGRDDPRADWRVVEREAKRLPKARVVMFDCCGHKPFSEQAPLFIETVAGFLAT
jgi:pimeloyl-ACP methyl ester carboxylesterase